MVVVPVSRSLRAFATGNPFHRDVIPFSYRVADLEGFIVQTFLKDGLPALRRARPWQGTGHPPGGIRREGRFRAGNVATGERCKEREHDLRVFRDTHSLPPSYGVR